MKIKTLVTDVDGVLTDGKFYYSESGKVFKKFGPHDADGIKIIKALNIDVVAISADSRGFGITQKRLNDMGIPIYQVSEKDRFSWISNKYTLDETVFIGDGLYDVKLLLAVAVGLTPANAIPICKKVATHTLTSYGGNGAILEAAIWILKHYYNTQLDFITKFIGFDKELMDILLSSYQ